MNTIKIREYLKRCDEEILSPALEAGLDMEFYYNYLHEMHAVIALDSALNANYVTLLSRVQPLVMRAYRENVSAKWVTDIGAYMGLQLEVIERMMEFACQYAERDLQGVIVAQANFMRLMLQRQNYTFDTIVFYAQSNWLLKQTKPSSEVADLMTKNHQLMLELDRLFAEVE